jgi:ribonuclease HI
MHGDGPGRWSFTLESADGAHSVKVEDAEPQTHGERLELLAVVRGLEALPQPAALTLITTSPYVHRVLNGGLDDWRANDWRWERHGELVPVKNADLWRRVDRALAFHRVDAVNCRSEGRSSSDDRPARPAFPNLVARQAAESPAQNLEYSAGQPQLARCYESHRPRSWARKVLLASKIARCQIRRRLRGLRAYAAELQDEAKRNWPSNH